MNNNTKYKKTLIRMFLTENLGESIYNTLSSKAPNEEKASIYKRLSLNEAATASHIVNELKKLSFSVPTIRKAILKVAAFAIFSVLSHNMLENLLKKTLKKSMFRSWFNLYHKYNENFWQSMLDHETLQYELLNL